jgi:C-terminal processing protease CtpA/Prc
MRRLFIAMIWVAGLALLVSVPDVRAQFSDRATLEASLGFEDQQDGDHLVGWTANPPETISLDSKVLHSGKWAVRLARDAGGSFSAMYKVIPVDFGGTTIEYRGFLRTEDVTGFAGLYMGVNSGTRALAFDNMNDQNLNGSTEWKEYSIKLPLSPEARELVFGIVLSGTGKAWVDDLQLLVDGQPIARVPKRELPKTVLEVDHQFDAGSGVAPTELTKVQIDNLATLGMVWGFLKYHHPKITSGQSHWDYELFRVLPAILDARDQTAAAAAMVKWIGSLGEVAPCNPCAVLEDSNLHLRPDLTWIENETLLGQELSRSLRAIYANRPRLEEQFYLSLAPFIQNPKFEHELAYTQVTLPDPGYQLLGLYRFWTIIQYWFPNRDVIGEDWSKVLAEFVPRVALAKDKQSYQRELMALIARAHDTHANLWSSLDVRPPTGECHVPARARFIENRMVVTGFGSPEAEKTSGLNVGDVVTSVDDVPVVSLIEQWTPYYAASNEAARMRDMAGSLTRGACGDVSMGILRGGQELRIGARRVAARDDSSGWTNDLPGETFRLLSRDIAYLKLSSVKGSDAARYVEQAAGTKGLVIDIRNYPSEYVVYALGELLVDKETPFVRFTRGDPSTPGAFHWTSPATLTPRGPHYAGKVVILIDETSQSSAEYHAMAFRSAPNAVVVGSTTAGADGNVSLFALPGGQRSMISGIGIFYPDKRPTQRVGIIPDVESRPTIAGIRDGRDEVLEQGLRQILGNAVSAAEIEKMARH